MGILIWGHIDLILLESSFKPPHHSPRLVRTPVLLVSWTSAGLQPLLVIFLQVSELPPALHFFFFMSILFFLPSDLSEGGWSSPQILVYSFHTPTPPPPTVRANIKIVYASDKKMPLILRFVAEQTHTVGRLLFCREFSMWGVCGFPGNRVGCTYPPSPSPHYHHCQRAEWMKEAIK